jgi:hypothetical protein
MMVWVDKGLNPDRQNVIKENKSIFSLGDYRHNLPYKDQTDYFSSKVSSQPKQFLSWDDGTKFNPKFKKDI